MSQVGIRHHWQSQMPISEYVPLPSYLLVQVLPIVIISCHLIYLRFLLRNPLKAQCTYQVECCYIDPQLEFAKSWETLHLYIKQFGCCCSSHSTKALLSWAGSTNKRLTDTFEKEIHGEMHLNWGNPIIEYETSARFRFKAVMAWSADLSMNWL